MIPSHHGLAVYSGGNWSKAPGAQHDYMGFSATSKYIYTSGHPAPGSGLVNPLGLLRSGDAGKTWDKMGLEGEIDFHLLGAGWNSYTVYVWNPATSSRLREAGLYSMLSDGFAWRKAAAAGLKGEPRSVAAHPDNAAIVAVASSAGVFISTDSGDRFRPVELGKEGFSVFFDLDGKDLWFGRGFRERRWAVARPRESRFPRSRTMRSRTSRTTRPRAPSTRSPRSSAMSTSRRTRGETGRRSPSAGRAGDLRHPRAARGLRRGVLRPESGVGIRAGAFFF